LQRQAFLGRKVVAWLLKATVSHLSTRLRSESFKTLQYVVLVHNKTTRNTCSFGTNIKISPRVLIKYDTHKRERPSQSHSLHQYLPFYCGSTVLGMMLRALDVYKLCILNDYFALFNDSMQKAGHILATKQNHCYISVAFQKLVPKHLQHSFYFQPFPRYVRLITILHFQNAKNQVGHILPIKQVLIYTFCSPSETSFIALKIAFLSFTVFDISTYDQNLVLFDPENPKVGHMLAVRQDHLYTFCSMP